ncbi:hypothetical protein D3C76_1388070 [compost metagenome]
MPCVNRIGLEQFDLLAFQASRRVTFCNRYFQAAVAFIAEQSQGTTEGIERTDLDVRMSGD